MIFWHKIFKKFRGEDTALYSSAPISNFCRDPSLSSIKSNFNKPVTTAVSSRVVAPEPNSSRVNFEEALIISKSLTSACKYRQLAKIRIFDALQLCLYATFCCLTACRPPVCLSVTEILRLRGKLYRC